MTEIKTAEELVNIFLYNAQNVILFFIASEEWIWLNFFYPCEVKFAQKMISKFVVKNIWIATVQISLTDLLIPNNISAMREADGIFTNCKKIAY